MAKCALCNNKLDKSSRTYMVEPEDEQFYNCYPEYDVGSYIYRELCSECNADFLEKIEKAESQEVIKSEYVPSEITKKWPRSTGFLIALLIFAAYSLWVYWLPDIAYRIEGRSKPLDLGYKFEFYFALLWILLSVIGVVVFSFSWKQLAPIEQWACLWISLPLAAGFLLLPPLLVFGLLIYRLISTIIAPFSLLILGYLWYGGYSRNLVLFGFVSSCLLLITVGSSYLILFNMMM